MVKSKSLKYSNTSVILRGSQEGVSTSSAWKNKDAKALCGALTQCFDLPSDSSIICQKSYFNKAVDFGEEGEA